MIRITTDRKIEQMCAKARDDEWQRQWINQRFTDIEERLYKLERTLKEKSCSCDEECTKPTPARGM